ncbi:MAG: Tat pathway signal sequence domain protein [Sphingomonadales bacterium]|nr:Tat pathway signal sequence domain protein [Sphingomonadales bacterium]MDE2167866.1 Tat pathway signal sequence domain protein [Sphingomonadales bacterium]
MRLRFLLLLALLPEAVRAAPPPGWVVEAQDPATVIAARHGVIDIDSPRGVTLWSPQRLSGPTTITFEAMAVAKGGANDQVSDLNAFWMASEADGSSPLGRRAGRFEAYDSLRLYYLGIGGNRNTTTRLRRYVGQTGVRPLLPGHDRSDAPAMLRPNVWTRITLIARGHRIAVQRDGAQLFTLDDPAPYTSGWFGLRTTFSHLRIRRLTIATGTPHP